MKQDVVGKKEYSPKLTLMSNEITKLNPNENENTSALINIAMRMTATFLYWYKSFE